MNKLEQLIHYLASKVDVESGIYQTKLNKLLYFCDFDNYEKAECSITSSSYMKNHHGPTCKQLSFSRNKIADNDIQGLEIIDEGDGKKRYKAILGVPVTYEFTTEEVENINSVIERYGMLTSGAIENLSHKDIPRKYTKDQETIPYESVFYRTPEFSVVS